MSKMSEFRSLFLLFFCSLLFLPLASPQATCPLKEHGKDITAPNLSSRNNTLESSCCYYCSLIPNCLAYAWNNFEGGTCWFKGALGPIVDKGDATIGFMDGSLPQDPFKIVAFWRGTWDVAHISFAREANRYFPSIQAELGMTFEGTTDWSKLNDQYLADVDIIMFLDDKPSEAGHKAVVERFVNRGGGFLSFHVTAFTTAASSEWNWYHNIFLGSGNFWKNTWKPTPAFLQVEDRTHPSTKNLPEIWESQHNEWYAWDNDLRNNPDINILLSVHPSSFPLGTNAGETWYDGYYPVAWTNKNYRMLYVNMGHNDIDYNGNIDLSATFGGDVQNRFFKDAIKWLAYRDEASLKQKKEHPLFQAFAKN